MKITKACQKLLQESIDRYLHNAEIEARSVANCQNMPPWFKDKPAAYYEGAKLGALATIESILHIHNAYRGFKEVQAVTAGGVTYEYNAYYGIQEFYK